MQIKQGIRTYLPVLAVGAGLIGGYVPQAYATPDTVCSPLISTSVGHCTISRYINSISITSSGTILGGYPAINISGIVNIFTNSGLISGGNAGINNSGTINTFTNSGMISAGYNATGISTSGTISTLNNSGTISGEGTGLSVSGPIVSLTNSGTIISNNVGFYNFSTISTLINSGTISGGAGTGIINNSGVISALTNTGTILGDTNGIINIATISVLNNAQGGTAVGIIPLKYNGVLPNNYNLIVTSNASFGQLALTNPTGLMTFGVSTIASAVTAGTLFGVLSGVSSAALISTLSPGWSAGTIGGTSGAYLWTLMPEVGTPTTYDLIVCVGSCPSGGGGSNSGSSSGSSGSTSSTTGSTNTSASVPTNVTTGSSVSLSSIGVTAAPVLAGGALILANGNNSNQSFSVLSSNGIITAPSTGSATLSGVFSGVGAITFNGTGMVTISGANTYSGGSTIASGTISTSGSSPTGMGSVYVASGALLMGTGTISGAMTVAGNLKPGNSPGYLASSSSVTMGAGSTYLQDIAGTTQASATTPVGATGYYSYLNITGGQFIINSGATLTPRLSNLFQPTESGYGSTPYTPVLGDRFRIVTADGGIVGKFTTLTQPAGLTAGTQFLPFYNMASSNSIDLAVIPTSYTTTLSSSNANTRSVSSALDTMVAATKAGVSTSTQDQFLYATSAQNSASLPAYVQGLAGEIYATTVAVVSQATLRVQQAVMSHLGDTAAAPMMAGGINATPGSSAGIGSGLTMPGQAPLANVSSNPSVNPYESVTNATLNSGAAWGEIAYQRGNRSGDDNASGYSSNLYQLTLGVDAYSQGGIKLGGGLALSNTNVIANQGTGTVQQGSLFLYGKMPIQEFILDAMASYGLNSTDTSRGDITGLSSGFSTKGVRGNDALLSIGLSRPIELDNLRITPYIRATGQIVNQSSFSEGSSPAALSIDSFNGNGVRGVIGVALGSKATNPMNENYTYKVNFGVGADSSSLINPVLNASLAGIPTNITTPQAGTMFAQAGLYGTVKFADNAYAYAGVNGEFRSGSTLGNVNVGVRIQF